ncbi:MAG: hypothetical protein KDC90_01210 [Ignavibacteriae bacterium]|nr:hypothetical protein [Ignavibacteriota bacterium]
MNNLIDKEKEILREILNYSQIHLDILHKIAILNSEVFWKLTGLKDKKQFLPIGKPLGFISFCNNDNDIEQHTTMINNFVIDLIKKNNYKLEGIANWLLVLDRIGNINDSFSDDLYKNVINSISDSEINIVVDYLIDEFNEHFSLSHGFSEIDTPPKWNNLINSVSYFYPFDNPINLLNQLIEFSPTSINILRILLRLKPVPRASLFFLKQRNLNYISTDDIVKLIDDNENEISFFIFLLFNCENKEEWVSPTFIRKLISDYWESGGNWIYRECYSTKNIKNEGIQKICKTEVDNLLKENFSNETTKVTLVSNFKFEEDFTALGGWLESVKKEISFNQTFVNDLASKTKEAFINVKNNIPQYFNDSHLERNDWFSDVLDIKTQYATTYINWAFSKCEEFHWNEIIKSYTNLCYTLKCLYYGSHLAVLKANKITNKLIILISSLPQEGIKENRIMDLVEILTKILIYPWTRFNEREELVWNNKNYEPNYLNDAELFLTIKNLNKIYNSKNKEIFKLLFTGVLQISTTPWPIFSKLI